jgi:hypothetical protein
MNERDHAGPDMTMHLTEDDLVLHYYGEMTDREEAEASAHLRACAPCHDGYRRLQRVLAAVDEHAVALPALPDHFERTVWARLEPDMARGRRGWSWPTFGLLAPAGQLALAASVLLLVGAAFYAGRLMPRETGGPAAATPVVAAATAAAQLRERILLVDLSDHLEQSQMVLVELVSADGDDSGGIADEKKRAEQLVAANRLYRQTAITTGDGAIAELLDELELALVDIATSPDHASSRSLDELRRRIEAKGLLFKVRVVSSEVRQRQRNTVRERAGQRSTL